MSAKAGRSTKLYNNWRQMLRRCYDNNGKWPAYIGVTVCKRWYNFQLYAEDVSSMPNSNVIGFQLDKDLIKLGNKKYSPGMCSFVPRRINMLLVTGANKSGNFGIQQTKGKFTPKVRGVGYLGTFETAHEAVAAFRKAKTKLVRQIAKDYKGQIDPRVYKTLSGYTEKR